MESQYDIFRRRRRYDNLAAYNSNHDKVSATHDVTQGTGDHYYSAYSSASQRDVCLGAENNNNSLRTYTVSGYWDEETD